MIALSSVPPVSTEYAEDSRYNTLLQISIGQVTAAPLKHMMGVSSITRCLRVAKEHCYAGPLQESKNPWSVDNSTLVTSLAVLLSKLLRQHQRGYFGVVSHGVSELYGVSYHSTSEGVLYGVSYYSTSEGVLYGVSYHSTSEGVFLPG
jgi:hypothetical protein